MAYIDVRTVDRQRRGSSLRSRWEFPQGDFSYTGICKHKRCAGLSTDAWLRWLLSELESRVAEEVIDGEKLREGSSLGVVFSSREDGVT